MLYGCRKAAIQGVWADRITGLSEVNSGSSACGIPRLEAQQSKYESKRSSLPLNSFFHRRVIDARRVRDDEACRQLRSITKADWCILVVAIKVPDSVTDGHAVLLAAMKCHVMAPENVG